MLDSPVPAGADEGVHVALDQGIKASASWESVAGQILSSSEQWIATQCREALHPALEINLGFRNGDDLSNGHRLQDYSTAIADQIKELCGVQFESLRLRKEESDSTTVAIGEALNVGVLPGRRSIAMETRRSYATRAFVDEVRDRSSSLNSVLVPGVPLGLHVSYVTGLPRTWSRLWQPTVSGVLEDRAESAQIVDMAFDHRSIGDELGHRVRLAIAAWRISADGRGLKVGNRSRTR